MIIEDGDTQDAAPAAAPPNLTVTGGAAKLDLSWTAPSGTVTGYDVHYTSSTAVADDATASGSDAATAWVAVSRTEASPPTASQTISSLPDGTAYRVRVRTKTSSSNSAWVFGAGTTTGGIPEVPTDLEDLTTTNRIHVAWTWAGTSTTTGYEVAFDLATRKVSQLRYSITVPAGTTSLVISDSNSPVPILEGTKYRVAVRACERRCSRYADIVFFTGVREVYGLSHIFVTPGDASLALSWRVDTSSLSGDAPATHYEVAYTASTTVHNTAELGTDPAEEWVDAGLRGLATKYTITGLTNDQAYRLRFTVEREAGAGANAKQYFGSATPAVPDVAAPTSLTVTPGEGKLDLSWTASSGTLTGYDVHYTSTSAYGTDAVAHDAAASGADPSAAWVAVSRSGTTASQAISSLSNTEYRVRVRAKTASANSPWVFGAGTPRIVAPGAPGNVQVAAGDGSLTLTWQAPGSWGTWTASHFEIQWKKQDTGFGRVDFVADTSFAPADTTYTFTGDQTDDAGADHAVGNGTFYELRIRAVSWQPGTDGSDRRQIVNSAWVTVSGTPGAPAGPPTGLTVTRGDAKLDLSWTAPSSPVSAITGYDVHYTSAPAADVANDAAASGSNPATAWVAVTRSGTTATEAISSLVNNTTYRLRVRAKNANGNGAWVFGAGTPGTVPAAPSNLTVAAADGGLDLSWTAPAGPVTGYSVHYTSALAADVADDAAVSGNDPATGWAYGNYSGSGPSHTIGGLDNGTTYRVRVRASNADGAGAWAFGTGMPSAPAVSFGAPIVEAVEGASPSPITLTVAPPLATTSSVRLLLNDPDAPGRLRDLPRTIALPAGTGSVEVDLAANLPVENDVNDDTGGGGLRLEAGDSGPHVLGAPKVMQLSVLDNDRPAAPAGLSLAPGDRRAAAARAEPAGRGGVYQLRHKQASAADQAATTAGDPSTGWVTIAVETVAGQTEAPTTATITGLVGEEAYQVQVRANDGQPGAGNGWSDWSAVQAATTPYSVTNVPDPDLMTGMTVNDGTRDLHLNSSSTSQGLGVPDYIYTVQVSPGIRYITVAPAWTNTAITGVSAKVRYAVHGIDGGTLTWGGGDSGTPKQLDMQSPLGGWGHPRLTFTLSGVTSEPYRILFQQNYDWKAANDRLGRIHIIPLGR
ncbi:MAG: fibronectin type III domain-containing protein [Chloroflexi bacterium]|nr:fibronectin type III domain-containing protein [Chloroflexota bacterium]